MEATPSRKFHLSLNVAHLDRSVAFYRALLGVPPAKSAPDYAKFELEDPPVVLSLEPQVHAPGGSLNHLGLRLPDSEALVAVQRRLEEAGISTRREEGVECCYARQSKFWVTDPDRNFWEVYLLEDDLAHRGGGSAPSHAPTDPETIPALPVTWEHRLGDPVPERIELEDGAADQVLLQGSFNAELPATDQARLLTEAYRVLRVGRQLRAHGLVADRLLPSLPELPGPAAAVQRVPELGAPLQALTAAGFSGLYLEKLAATANFVHEGIALRELLLVATKAVNSPFDLPQQVVYGGPLAEVVDDAGHVFRRGEPTSVPNAAAEVLRSGAAAAQFTFLAPRSDK